MSSLNPSAAKSVGVFGWNYNRANFKYDQGLRWQRFTAGRKMACAQVGMFRQDVTDLAGVSMSKMKVYGPIYGIVITVCITVFVEGRSGLKFPGPPVFISEIYLQCLGIGMAFMALAMWLLFHAAMRAQLACIQLRTRKVRVPVPTQRQLDGSRKILSTWEEQHLYDMFRIPFVMPNGAGSPEDSEEEQEEEHDEPDESPQKGKKKSPPASYAKGGLPGVANKVKSKVQEAAKEGKIAKNARIPGLTPGHPTWYEKELEERDEQPENSPSAHGKQGPLAPYEHFELLRAAQKEWWGCEAYMRVCFLFGMIHLVMSFSYWIVLHNIGELGMVWCSILGAAGLTAGVWIMFRLDVLPEHGGCFPWEISGPFVTAVALGLMYSHTITQTMMDIARGVAAGIIIMHVLLTFRMYSVSKPTGGKAHHHAKESGGRLFNESGSCESPSWLPSAFQHVMYLVAPPKTQEQLEQEQQDRDNNALGEDPLAKVDMTPWRYVRIMIIATGLGWFIQLGGHACECIMGERMLTSNPGMPPWSRTGQWYGWEHGPISSKHYAHVTPQRGHWAWHRGWGPQGQQELWASDMFGFHPEADAWWAETEGPEPLVGAAGFGENTWSKGVIAYGQNEPQWGETHETEHDWDESGGHRRLGGSAMEAMPMIAAPRPVVPLAVKWPSMFEPDFIACGPEQAEGLAHAPVAALTATGLGALLPAPGAAAAAPLSFALEGLLELGLAKSATWGRGGLLVVTGSGRIASCPAPAAGSPTASFCSALDTPPLPLGVVAAVMEAEDEATVRAAIARPGGVAVLELRDGSEGPEWQEISVLNLMLNHETPVDDIISISTTRSHLLAVSGTGKAFKWDLHQGLPIARAPVHDIPAGGSHRSWRSACAHPNGKIMRLATSWQGLKASGASSDLLSELLL